MAIDPFVPEVIYAENWAQDGFVALHRSLNGGDSWQLIKDTQYGANMSGDPLLKIEPLAIDPHIPNTVYFCNWGEGFFKSEVEVGTHSIFGIYTPPTVSQGKPFNMQIVALDSDKYVIPDYIGIVNLSVDKGSITPTFISNFTNGRLIATITLSQVGTITITVRDGDKVGTTTIFVTLDTFPHLIFKKYVRNITRNTDYQDTINSLPGDILEYKLELTNIDSDTARWVVITDVMPEEITYQKDSVLINGATQTDQLDDDAANFSNNTNTITIGRDKDNTTDNPIEITIPAKGTATIIFRAKIE